MDCVAIGDSIAVGTGPELSCEIRAAVGLTSSRIIPLAGGRFHAYCIVSAGSNDPTSPKLTDNLTSIRNQSKCKVYVWIEPANKAASKVVKDLARQFGDKTVTFTPGQDGVHPASYKAVAGDILAVTGN